MNLMLNGMDAIASVDDGSRELLIRANHNEAGQVTVAVTDFGIGIDPAVEERLFNPFFTTKPDGTGMGLSICRSIIEFHGGQIWASRNPERGATFQFSLPLYQRISLGAGTRHRACSPRKSKTDLAAFVALYDFRSSCSAIALVSQRRRVASESSVSST